MTPESTTSLLLESLYQAKSNPDVSSLREEIHKLTAVGSRLEEVDYPDYSIVHFEMDLDYYLNIAPRKRRRMIGMCSMQDKTVQAYLPAKSNKLSFYIAEYLSDGKESDLDFDVETDKLQFLSSC